MKNLPGCVRVHMVVALACDETPTRVVASVKADFGIDVSRQCVEAHHPERRAGAKLNLALRELFYETRAKLLTELDNIPIACQAYRLKMLDRAAAQAEAAGNLPLAMQVLEQAAREVGIEPIRAPAPCD
ncbi:DUF2280 domain-containing protein [Rugamonas sp. CCM 8940]|uniref:DUF2280 domain-containing protein n=1 Tax=Rugamonas sp. CCM 8940 TaxID=2765359 RepID=UPI001F1744C4|nr:DUF2280 domain-containing protein [Rugamonas sp. CCM 8940]